MANIRLSKVHKSYGSTEIIHGVDWDIDDGEFVVIVGPSGCGKSTLLRMIAGLEVISDGDVFIGDRKVNDLEPAERDIAMVFQNYALYPHMSVFNNMAYGLKLRGIAKADIRERVDRAADILDLSELLQRSPRQLSGGQRQRVAMGRAIVREPSVFLFDEPLSNLDAKLRVQMRLEIKQLQERLGITSVYVTHDQVEAMTLGHRLMVLNAGNVEQLGTPIELYDRPATIFVAGFLGSPAMNFIPVQNQVDGLKMTLDAETTITLAAPIDVPAEASLTVGIRPEHLQVSTDKEALANLQVRFVEHLGADTLIHGQLGSDPGNISLRIAGTNHFEIGANIPLTIAADNIHVFATKSGKRIN